MSEIKIFQNNQFGEIRTATTEKGEPLFCLTDLCASIGITNSRNVKNRLEIEDVHQVDTLTAGGIQQTAFVTESGMYDVIIRSDSENAKPFRKWVTSEVLPSIRKNGIYATDSVIDNILSDPDFGIKLLTNLKEEKQKRLEAEHQLARKDEVIEIQNKEISQLAPKAEYADKVLISVNSFTTNQIAKEYGVGAETLNAKLKSLGVQYKQNDQWLLYSKYQDKGYTKTNTYQKTVNEVERTWHSTVWTEKGRKFIHELLKDNPPRTKSQANKQVSKLEFAN